MTGKLLAQRTAASGPQSGLAEGYDPRRDPEKDLAAARAEAKKRWFAGWSRAQLRDVDARFGQSRSSDLRTQAAKIGGENAFNIPAGAGAHAAAGPVLRTNSDVPSNREVNSLLSPRKSAEYPLWSRWNFGLDRFFDEHPNLEALRDKNYVPMKVSMSQENPNCAFLSRSPTFMGIRISSFWTARGN
jgi:hypothetical protein